MGRELDLLRSLPRARRDVAARAAARDPEVVRTARQYGREYFDGDRKFGYGGYKYDGRWRSVATDLIAYYKFGTSAVGYGDSPRVLDVGCAKGFLVHELHEHGLGAFGIDISEYAVVKFPHSSAVGCLHLGTADDLPFPDKSFDLVLSINTLHNLPRPRLVRALREITRVSRGSAFVQVDSYRTPAEKALFEQWVLTAQWHGYPDDWLALFAEAGYVGDYGFTIVEAG